MKSVLISIQPKWCEKIVAGEKTVEVRKTMPKINAPFKCYIYCTSNRPYLTNNGNSDNGYDLLSGYSRDEAERIFGILNGKVIGEFVCDYILSDKTFGHNDSFYAPSCLDVSEIAAYCTNAIMYGWHISDLVIYDEPKNIGEFYTECQMNCEHCEMWGYTRVNADEFDMECQSNWFIHKPLTRPPQSWCYVEEVNENEL